MKYAAYLWSAVTICVVLIVVLLIWINRLDSRIRSLGDPNRGALTTLQDSLKRVQADLTSVKELAPGLGEYMTTIQLHAGNSFLPPGLRIGTWRNTSLTN